MRNDVIIGTYAIMTTSCWQATTDKQSLSQKDFFLQSQNDEQQQKEQDQQIPVNE